MDIGGAKLDYARVIRKKGNGSIWKINILIISINLNNHTVIHNSDSVNQNNIIVYFNQ